MPPMAIEQLFKIILCVRLLASKNQRIKLFLVSRPWLKQQQLHLIQTISIITFIKAFRIKNNRFIIPQQLITTASFLINLIVVAVPPFIFGELFSDIIDGSVMRILILR